MPEPFLAKHHDIEQAFPFEANLMPERVAPNALSHEVGTYTWHRHSLRCVDNRTPSAYSSFSQIRTEVPLVDACIVAKLHHPPS